MSTEENKVVIIDRKFTDKEGYKHYNDFKVIRKYGEGSVGVVKEISNIISGKHYAMKIVNKLLLQMRKEYVRIGKGKMGIKTAFDAVEKEINIIKELDHENIVKLYEILTDEENEKLYLILDNCEKGEIMKWNAEKMEFIPWNGETYFTEDQIRSILIDSIQGLLYLHDLGIMHRDIKPQNLLMNKAGKVKIGDFGVAQKVKSKENDTLTNTQGTYHFMPPEWWNYETKEFSGIKADVWALGVTLYALTYNKLPFWADNELELGNVIMKNDIDFNNDRDASIELKQLIRKMLNKDPKERADLADILQNDPFFRHQD